MVIEESAKKPDMVAVAVFAGVIHKFQDLEAEKKEAERKANYKVPEDLRALLYTVNKFE